MSIKILLFFFGDFTDFTDDFTDGNRGFVVSRWKLGDSFIRRFYMDERDLGPSLEVSLCRFLRSARTRMDEDSRIRRELVLGGGAFVDGEDD
jgi:hypothetical protein